MSRYLYGGHSYASNFWLLHLPFEYYSLKNQYFCLHKTTTFAAYNLQRIGIPESIYHPLFNAEHLYCTVTQYYPK